MRPISRAALSPTVIVMSKAGASGVSRWLGDIHAWASSPRPGRLNDDGDVERLSVPPATMTSVIPAMIEEAPIWMAESPAAQ